MDDDEFESSVQVILEIFPSYNRSYCERWLKLYSGDVAKVCDYLAQCPVVNNDEETSPQRGHRGRREQIAKQLQLCASPVVRDDEISARPDKLYRSSKRVKLTQLSNDGGIKDGACSQNSSSEQKPDKSSVSAEVLFAYNALTCDELTICQGDIVRNVKTKEFGWLEGEVNGKRGVFPGSFVQVNDTAKPRKKYMFKAVAKYDSQAEVDGELSFKSGDVIQVVQTDISPGGWWKGESGGERGIFPSCFVEEVLNDAQSTKPLLLSGSQISTESNQKLGRPACNETVVDRPCPSSSTAMSSRCDVLTGITTPGENNSPSPTLSTKLDMSSLGKAIAGFPRTGDGFTGSESVVGSDINASTNINDAVPITSVVECQESRSKETGEDFPMTTEGCSLQRTEVRLRIAKDGLLDFPINAFFPPENKSSNVNKHNDSKGKPAANEQNKHTASKQNPDSKECDNLHDGEQRSERNEDLLPENTLSEKQEEQLMAFFARQGKCDERKQENQKSKKDNQDTSSQERRGRKGKGQQGKRIQLLGKVKKVLPEKRFGFILPNQETSAGDGNMRGEGDGSNNDVFFHYDNVRSCLFMLKPFDLVQYNLYESKNKKVSAVNVILLKPVRRNYAEISNYLDILDEQIENSIAEKKANSNIAQMMASPIIWNHLSDMISKSTENGNVLIFKLVNVINKLETVVKSLDESFRQILSALTNPVFFNPFRGRLKDVIKETDDPNQLDELQKFLLLIARCVPEKTQAVIALTKPVVDKALPASMSFLFQMLRIVSKLTAGSVGDMEWNNLPLIMTNEEIHSQLTSEHINLRAVKRKGPYESPTEYIETYFRLLRTDAFSSLKKGVKNYLNNTLDKRDMNVYVNVVLYGIEVSNQCLYLALKVTPTQKVRNWETSSNLMFGNLLCLSLGGNFKHVIWATVADRDLLKSDSIVMVQSCSEYNSLSDGEMIIDMISMGMPIVVAESPTYYRAYQPVLKSLQAMDAEDMSFSKELVYLQEDDDLFIDRDETFDATLVYKDYSADNGRITVEDFIANDYDEGNSVFDESQEMAVKMALISNIGIIQGPPGSGKSFIGVQMLRILLSMSSTSKVLILTYKNHALDEFVKSALNYFPDKIVRIGGRSRDSNLDKVGLRGVRRDGKRNFEFKDQTVTLEEEMEKLREDIEKSFDDLNKTSNLSYADIFSELTPEQLLHLIKECDWSKSNLPSFGVIDDDGFITANNKKKRSRRKKISSWEVGNILSNLSQHQNEVMILANAAFKLWVPEDSFFSKGESELSGCEIPVQQRKQCRKDTKEDEQEKEVDAQEMEEERKAAWGGGHRIPLRGKAKYRIKTRHATVNDNKECIRAFSIAASKKLLGNGPVNCENLWELEPMERVYFIQYIAVKQREIITNEFEENVKLFDEKVKQLAEIRNQLDVVMLEDKQIIAMTITGASIHHMLLKEMQPEIVIVEEAAEILEPHLVAAIGDWTKYMLLIGDHYQLRPSVETYELKRDFNFDLSLMERLVNNNMRYTTLEMQNRQRPEFAKLLMDIYPELKTNFKRVKDNEPAICLEKSSFFWHHEFQESKERSVTNEKEGERAVMLALFLIQQGYRPSQVTILATYQGQTTLIRSCLKEKIQMYKDILGSKVSAIRNKEEDDGSTVAVQTVDMYQGDENDFVIISLVRSNKNNGKNNIGFLNERNRRCVAQSRAKCGVYFIGNATMFIKHPTWEPMMSMLKEDGRIGAFLEIKCKYHPHVCVPVERLTLQGFCVQPCSFEMVCGIHKCNLRCQPPHRHSPCERVIPFTHVICGHQDTRKCKESQDNKKCHSEVTFTFAKCLHEGKKKCFEYEGSIVCKFQEMVNLPLCGHIKEKKCSENVNDLKCLEKCARSMKCDHPCDHTCHEHETITKCETCERKKRIEADKRRKVEEEIRKKRLQQIEVEIQQIRKKLVTKGELTKEKLNPDTPEYLDIEDMVKKYIQVSHAWYPIVSKIEKVTNYYLRIKWLQLKRELFDSEGRSALKFHGTSNEGIAGITKDGFLLPTNGTPMYGFGVYFASDSSKSAQHFYTKGSNKLLLCDVLLGKSLTVDKECRDMTAAKLREKRCDSLFAKRGTKATGGVLYDEFVIFEPAAAYPTYIIHYDEGGAFHNPTSDINFGTTFDTGHQKIQPTRGHKANDPLDTHFRIAESQFLRLLHRMGVQQKYVVKEVEVYMNPKLKQNFEQKSKEFEGKYPAGSIESQYLMVFHGTKDRRIVENIMDNNFNKSTIGKFGAGVYFSEIPEYTFGYGGSNHLILAKILPGKIYNCSINPVATTSSLTNGYDSHGGIPLSDGRFSELVIFDTNQILPCYVIHI